MAIDAIVRVSFQTNTAANQAANSALVGHAQNPTGPGPFARVNTAVYSAQAKPDADVVQALAALMMVVGQPGAALDFLSISLTTR